MKAGAVVRVGGAPHKLWLDDKVQFK